MSNAATDIIGMSPFPTVDRKSGSRGGNPEKAATHRLRGINAEGDPPGAAVEGGVNATGAGVEVSGKGEISGSGKKNVEKKNRVGGV